jgi:hypothetical protein
MVGMRLAMMDLRRLTAVALVGLLTLPVAAFSSVGAAASSGEASSAQRKKVRVRKPAPAPKAYRWRPADPSFDQNGRLYKPPPGLPCPVDLGYGRWTSCLWDD